VQVANDNCPGQVVISGSKVAVEHAIAGAKAAGAKRGVPLAVSIAAHSPLMASIQDEWDQAVDACAMTDPEIPVVGNVNARSMTGTDELRADIKAQMNSRVRWTESVVAMLKSGTQAFVEVGSGEVLLGLLRRIVKSQGKKFDVSGYPLGTPSDFKELES
jgi:[acyl-carrier-protein] S-malonyltransferase